jgi:hypothetical protein
MFIDQSVLQDLNDAQLSYSSRILEDVFLHNKGAINHLDTYHIQTIHILIKSIPSDEMKNKILASLHADMQFKVLKLMAPLDLKHTFNTFSDISFLKLYFQHLDSLLQQDILKDLYAVDKARYKSLKDASGQNLSMIGGLLVKSDDSTEALYKKEIRTLLAMIKNPHTSTDKLLRFGKHLDKALYSIEGFLDLFIRHFVAKKIALNSSASFATHLKFYTFLVPYIVLYPDIKNKLSDPLDQLLLSLDKMPDTLWVIKVLNQLPPLVIRIAIARLQSYERIPEFQKRNIYSKLLKVVNENIHTPHSSNIKLALQSA